MIKDMDKFLDDSTKSLEYMVETLSNLQALDFESLEPKKTMLASLDMNNGFAKSGALYSPRVEKLIPGIAKLTSMCLQHDILSIAYTDSHPSSSPELESYPNHCLQGSIESEIVDEIRKFKKSGLIIVNKNSTNGMLSMNPLADFNSINVSKQRMTDLNTFIITGCVTDICIYQYATTLKAYLNEHNINARVIVPLNLVDTFEIPDIHNAQLMNLVFLNSMISNGIEVVKSINI